MSDADDAEWFRTWKEEMPEPDADGDGEVVDWQQGHPEVADDLPTVAEAVEETPDPEVPDPASVAAVGSDRQSGPIPPTVAWTDLRRYFCERCGEECINALDSAPARHRECRSCYGEVVDDDRQRGTTGPEFPGLNQ